MNKDYLKSVESGLVDATGIVKLEFIKNSKYPQMLATEMSKATPKLSSKQARSCYNVVNKIYLDVLTNKLSIPEAIVELTMLSSRVNDKFNKGSVPTEFKEFMEKNIDVIKDTNTLKAFVLHFEAICNNLKDTAGSNNTGKPAHTTNNRNNGGQKRW